MSNLDIYTQADLKAFLERRVEMLFEQDKKPTQSPCVDVRFLSKSPSLLRPSPLTRRTYDHLYVKDQLNDLCAGFGVYVSIAYDMCEELIQKSKPTEKLVAYFQVMDWMLLVATSLQKIHAGVYQGVLKGEVDPIHIDHMDVGLNQGIRKLARLIPDFPEGDLNKIINIVMCDAPPTYNMTDAYFGLITKAAFEKYQNAYFDELAKQGKTSYRSGIFGERARRPRSSGALNAAEMRRAIESAKDGDQGARIPPTAGPKPITVKDG